MQHKSSFPFLLCFFILSLLYLQAQALPALERYSAMSENALNEEITPVKRHSDAEFTDGYSRQLIKEKLEKYLSDVLGAKIRLP
uniref:VIP-like peptide isoform 3 VLP3 n=1 Tax=Desmognathus ocoee TaxID=179530 RepID=A0A0H4AFL4_9SALA|nr:VIP-like peptide isoform 3 VLP3 [Desmognathus ocoee]